MADELRDRQAVVEVVQRERAARDQGLWDVMADCYLSDATARILWFDGSGAEFVETSRQHYEAGQRVVHAMGPTSVRVHAHRALADSGCAVNAVRRLDDVDLDLVVHLRLWSRLERAEGRWRLRTLEAVFSRDQVSLRNPQSQLQVDADELASYRESYQWLSYIAAHSGRTPDQDRPGFDRLDLVDPLRSANEAWLMEEQR